MGLRGKYCGDCSVSFSFYQDHYDCRKTTITILPYLRLWCGLHSVFSFNDQYRYDHRARTCYRHPITIFQLRWFIALVIHHPAFRFHQTRCLPISDLKVMDWTDEGPSEINGIKKEVASVRQPLSLKEVLINKTFLCYPGFLHVLSMHSGFHNPLLICVVQQS